MKYFLTSFPVVREGKNFVLDKRVLDAIGKNQPNFKKCVVIVHEPTWNDFGKRNSFYFFLVKKDEIFPEVASPVNMFKAIVETSEMLSALDSDRDSIKDFRIISDVTRAFRKTISQIQSEAGYKFLATIFTKSELERFLLKIKDAGYLKLKDSKDSSFQLINHTQFNKSLLREKPASYAYEQGLSSVLVTIDDKITDDLRFKKDVVYEEHIIRDLKTVIDVDFNDDLSKMAPIYAVIGKNGTGKSTKILEVFKAVGNSGKSFQNAVLIRISQKDSLRIDRNGNVNAGISLFTPGNLARFAVNIYQKDIDSTEYFSRREIALDALASFMPEYTADWNALRSLYLDESDHENLRAARVTNFFNNKKFSPGQLAILKILFVLLDSLNFNSLILVDEPETGLHPNFITDLMRLIEDLCKRTKSVALLATHSVFIVRECIGSHVQILEFKNKRFIARKCHFETYGSSLDRLAYEIFGDSNVKKSFERNIDNALLTEVASRSPELTFKLGVKISV